MEAWLSSSTYTVRIDTILRAGSSWCFCAQVGFNAASIISDVTKAHGQFVRRLHQGFFLVDPAADSALANARITSAVELMFNQVQLFSSLVLDHDAARRGSGGSAARSLAAQKSTMEGFERIKAAFYSGLSELFIRLHNASSQTQFLPLLSRLRAVEFWERHVAVDL